MVVETHNNVIGILLAFLRGLLVNNFRSRFFPYGRRLLPILNGVLSNA
jgi:hypothetical protein